MICGSGHPSPGFEFILSRLASLTYSLDSSILRYSPFWIKPWLFSRTLECTFRSRLRTAHSRTNLHGEIHKRGHDEDYRLYADYHVLRENRGSSFRIFHEWHYRDTQPEMKARGEYIKEAVAKFNVLKNYPNAEATTFIYYLLSFKMFSVLLYYIIFYSEF